MDTFKKLLGLIWLTAGPVAIFFLFKSAFDNIDADGTKDINNPVIWIIIIAIFFPIAVGLMIFGWYALKDEYNSKHFKKNNVKVM